MTENNKPRYFAGHPKIWNLNLHFSFAAPFSIYECCARLASLEAPAPLPFMSSTRVGFTTYHSDFYKFMIIQSSGRNYVSLHCRGSLTSQLDTVTFVTGTVVNTGAVVLAILVFPLFMLIALVLLTDGTWVGLLLAVLVVLFGIGLTIYRVMYLFNEQEELERKIYDVLNRPLER